LIFYIFHFLQTPAHRSLRRGCFFIPLLHKVQSVQSFSPYQRYIKLLSQCEYTHITEILLRFSRNDRCLCRKVS